MRRSRLSIIAVVVLLSGLLGLESIRLFGADANQASIDLAKQQKVLAQNALQRLTDLENRGQIIAEMRRFLAGVPLGRSNAQERCLKIRSGRGYERAPGPHG